MSASAQTVNLCSSKIIQFLTGCHVTRLWWLWNGSVWLCLCVHNRK